ncbi:restriction endonuclease subunit S [bacterium]|nr:restriction endonuclease subunit S [bacterium]
MEANFRNLPNLWTTKTLGELLIVLKNGLNCKQNKNGDGDPVSRIETISFGAVDYSRVGYATINKGDREKHTLLAGDILFSHINSPIHVGKTAILDGDRLLYHGVNLLLLRCSTEIDSSYLNGYLKYIFNSGYWVRRCKQSVNQASVNQKDIKKVKVPVPPLPEQERIVGVLDEAFEGIATATAQAEKNLQNARELFQSVLQSTFSQKGDDWMETTLGEHIKFIDYRGKTPRKTVNGLRLITAKNVRMGYLQKEPEEFVAHDTYEEWMTRGIPLMGDVLFTTEAPLGLACQLDTDEKVVFAQRIITFQPNRSLVDPTYLKYVLMSPVMQSRIHDQATGATAQGIKASLLKKTLFPCPNLSTQTKIVEKLDALSEETKRLEAIYQRKLDALAELKQSLLQRAFTGQL